MLDTLTLVHRPRKKVASDLARDQPRAVIFRTCLRQIGFLRGGERASERFGAADEVYVGEGVYRQGRPFEKILDLRGESGRDPLAPARPEVGCSTEIVSLLTLFAELQSQRVAVEARLAAAGDGIRRSARAYAEREEIHPFGWEDLCA